MPLRIGFDAKRLFLNREGLGSYARSLVSDIQKYFPEHQYHLFTPSCGDLSDTTDFMSYPFRVHTPEARMPGWFWRRYRLARLIDQLKLDVYIGLSNELPVGLVDVDCKSIACIHDLIYLDFPGQFGTLQRKITASKTRHAVSRADRIVAISHFTRNRLLDTFNVPESRVSVIYQSVEPQPPADLVSLKLPGSYFLFVGSMTQRKNPFYILNALREMDAQDRPHIVMVGQGKLAPELQSKSQSLGLSEIIHFVGNTDNRTLSFLYSKASGLIFPSLYEGFGRPVLEALHFRIPVFLGEHSSLREVAGQYGTVIDLKKPSSLAEALTRKTAGKDMRSLEKHLGQFDPKTLARQWMNLISEMV